MRAQLCFGETFKLNNCMEQVPAFFKGSLS